MKQFFIVAIAFGTLSAGSLKADEAFFPPLFECAAIDAFQIEFKGNAETNLVDCSGLPDDNKADCAAFATASANALTMCVAQSTRAGSCKVTRCWMNPQ